MKAIVYSGAGDVGVIELRDVAAPEPGSDDAQVAVAYVGLNRAEALYTRGRYLEQPRLPGRVHQPAAQVHVRDFELVRGVGARRHVDEYQLSHEVGCRRGERDRRAAEP